MSSAHISGRLLIVTLGSIILYLIYNIGSIFLIDPRTYPTLFIVVTVFGVVGFGLGIYLAARWALKPRRYRETERIGLLVQAQVIDCVATGWKHKQSRGFATGISEREYRVTVELNQPDQPRSQATVYGYFPNNQIPRRNQYLSLRIHPRDPKIVVLAKAATE
ncbi:MAG TPA: hypothetical protein DEF47_08015 [Herpetosiphon sp.]|uniref:DUF3592 domain-containing protein n=1 Tax=Herpetosiphon aurantiacus (strain ATCC 23779 / DSM 785 / 114-95) TaxID=316274 RepID=A9B7B9_HERA2|nr:hypothetical protein [Herpetosiphon sp.]ABX06402.1 hypothetical protein Haur_3766 [Herpetosiphon aurantiacus DSM 785]HBW49837.1 hypothetical protein [Herpetosiphon sp.]